MKTKTSTLRPLKHNYPEKSAKLFVKKLLSWNRKENNRRMPWKGEKDPYRIWLSEIILQQTRVDQGMKYYENFITAFPNVHALAKAPEDKIYKLWEGLGYYSRCRNLIATAKNISGSLKGVFPNDFDSILQLKGVGNYTASAIASFAYDLPYAVLDGNVFRVLSRIFNINSPIDSTSGKKYFSILAQAMLPPEKAGEYNQAIMDFGAVICKPYPECKICFFNKYCNAFLAGKQDLLPVKATKVKIRERWLSYFIVKSKGRVLIRQRITNDIWQQLFEFVLIETDGPLQKNSLLRLLKKQFGISGKKAEFLNSAKQKLSHQLINFSFFKVELPKMEAIPGFFWVKIADLNEYAFPKTLQEFVRTELK